MSKIHAHEVPEQDSTGRHLPNIYAGPMGGARPGAVGAALVTGLWEDARVSDSHGPEFGVKLNSKLPLNEFGIKIRDNLATSGRSSKPNE
ncbi:hypothetical protein CYMTET_9010 [Cymbomonas tetramitiformis]|uniref:Uncharacterized protein n=1 Tax=Cymbomonas tetramitiformis TaxID=36881 RepID=A0AAE0LFA7_9CHLO|nr:hypothetical protein CYMTET_9010 [Cymbomonas tetramitiformis]